MPKRKPPSTTDELLKVLNRAYADLVKDLELLVQKALAESGNGENWSVAFTRRQIAMVKARIEELSGVVLGAPGEDGLAAQLTDSAYKVGLQSIDFGLTLQGIVPGPIDPALHMGISRSIAQELTEGYSGMFDRILRERADEFRDIQARSVMSALAKGDTGDELIGQIIEQIKGKAVDGRFRLVKGQGRNWAVEDYAEMLSRTVAAKAEREASRARMIEEGTDLVIVIGGLIGTSCETCQKAVAAGPLSLTGQTPGYRTVGEFENMSPPLGHVRCLLPGTRVVAPDLFTVTRGWYVGDAVELLLASGTLLSTTVNHVLLSSNGWVRAGELREGDDVVYCPGLERVMGTDPQYDQVPARVEDVFAAASVANGMSTVSVPVASEDLHGDGHFVEGNVDVIAPASLLRSGGPSASGQGLGYQFLHPSRAAACTFAGSSELTPKLIRLGFAADSIVGRSRSLGASFWAERRHVYRDLFAEAALPDPEFAEPVVNDGLRDTVAALDSPDAFPGGIAPCKVLKVNRYPFRGHVYDLHSLSTLYVCNGVVSSNCGHTYAPYYPESGLSEDEVRGELEQFEANTGFDVRWEGTGAA